jgi:hypothetical protein
MTLQDLIIYFHTDNMAKIGRLLGVGRSAVHWWASHGISYARQLQIEKLTNGALKAKESDE